MRNSPRQQPRVNTRWILVALLASLCWTPSSRSQSQSPPPPDSSSTNTQEPAQTPQASRAPAKAPSKPKHIITNDDFEPSPKVPNSSSRVNTESATPILTCDSVCEQDARNQLGYGPDYEADWQSQIVEARRNLIGDTEWRGLLSQAIRQSDSYCKFQLQQSHQLSSGRGDFQSRTQSAKNAQYYENMDRALRQQLEITANRMQTRIQEVQILSPVRAALMSVQASRIGNRPCGDQDPR